MFSKFISKCELNEFISIPLFKTQKRDHSVKVKKNRETFTNHDNNKQDLFLTFYFQQMLNSNMNKVAQHVTCLTFCDTKLVQELKAPDNSG